MAYPNAYKGVKKLFVAEILMLLVGAAGVVVSVITAIFNQNAELTSEELAQNPGFVILLLGTAVVALVAGIIKFIGLIQAGRDERYFHYAVFIVFANIIVTIILAFLTSKGTTLYSLLEMFANIFEVLVSIFVIYGIITLAAALGDENGVYSGKRVINIMMTIYLLVIAMKVLEMVFGEGNTITELEIILGIVVAVLSVASYVLYLFLLVKAMKMLKK